jgi:hypothetical protein
MLLHGGYRMSVKVFIGTEERQKISTAVLKHSILKRTKETVEFVEMNGWQTGLRHSMYTGFSFFRFAVPEKCNFQGRAIVMDTDIIVLGDISELHNSQMNKPVLARAKIPNQRYTSMMLIECEKAKWDFKSLVKYANISRVNYTNVMWNYQGSPIYNDFGDLDINWNQLDKCPEGTKALHFTNVPTQPWTYPKHPFRKVFLRELRSALLDGYIKENTVRENIKHLYGNILEDAKNV